MRRVAVAVWPFVYAWASLALVGLIAAGVIWLLGGEVDPCRPHPDSTFWGQCR